MNLLFFFIQTPKRKESSDVSNTSQSIIQRENPHKYLLYKPSFSQFYAYITAAFKDLPPHGIMMIYISADAFESNSKKGQSDRIFTLFFRLFFNLFFNGIKKISTESYEFGGLKTNFKREQTTSPARNLNSKSFDNLQSSDLNASSRKTSANGGSVANKESHW